MLKNTPDDHKQILKGGGFTESEIAGCDNARLDAIARYLRVSTDEMMCTRAALLEVPVLNINLLCYAAMTASRNHYLQMICDGAPSGDDVLRYGVLVLRSTLQRSGELQDIIGDTSHPQE